MTTIQEYIHLYIDFWQPKIGLYWIYPYHNANDTCSRIEHTSDRCQKLMLEINGAGLLDTLQKVVASFLVAYYSPTFWCMSHG